MNDIVLNKKESIERCISQVRAYYATPSNLDFEEDYMKQDSIAINLQRACEQCIDLAKHLERMVGFRNILVHEYQRVDIGLMIEVIENHLDDLVLFTNHIVAALGIADPEMNTAS